MTEQESLRWQFLTLVVAVGALLYLLAPVLTPFATAALFAYLGDPLTRRLERWGLGRTAAVCVVFTLMALAVTGIILVLIPLLQRQIGYFIEQLPRYMEWIRGVAAPWLEEHFGLAPDLFDTSQIIAMLQQHWREAGGIAAAVVAHVSKSGLAIANWILHLVLVPVVTFYLLRDWDSLIARAHALVPRALEPTVVRLTRESDEVLGGFLRGQLTVMLVLGVLYAVGLSLAGIAVGPLIGILAALISFVPYLGVIVGVSAGVIAALVQFHDWLHVVLVLVVFGIGHVLESYILVPRLIGDKIGLHPVAVIFAVLAGGELFGFLGVLLALPAASIVMVLLRYLYERYTASTLYRTAAVPDATAMVPPESVAIDPAAPASAAPKG